MMVCPPTPRRKANAHACYQSVAIFTGVEHIAADEF